MLALATLDQLDDCLQNKVAHMPCLWFKLAKTWSDLLIQNGRKFFYTISWCLLSVNFWSYS